MTGDRHFSHPHPLTSFVDDMEADDTDQSHVFSNCIRICICPLSLKRKIGKIRKIE